MSVATTTAPAKPGQLGAELADESLADNHDSVADRNIDHPDAAQADGRQRGNRRASRIAFVGHRDGLLRDDVAGVGAHPGFRKCLGQPVGRDHDPLAHGESGSGASHLDDLPDGLVTGDGGELKFRPLSGVGPDFGALADAAVFGLNQDFVGFDRGEIVALNFDAIGFGKDDGFGGNHRREGILRRFIETFTLRGAERQFNSSMPTPRRGDLLLGVVPESDAPPCRHRDYRCARFSGGGKIEQGHSSSRW